MTRLLGIEVAERELRVARAERSLGTLRVTALERVARDDSAALARLAALRPHAVLTALPAAAVAHRFLVLPFRDRRRLDRTVPLELLGQLPVEPEGGRVVFTRVGSSDAGTTVLAALVLGTDLAALAAPLTAAGLAPTRIDLAPLPVWNLLPSEPADLALVLADGDRSALSLRRAGRLAAVRALAASGTDVNGFAAEVRWSLAALGDAPPTVVLAGADGGSALGAALAAATRARVVSIAELISLTVPHGAQDLGACAVAAGLVAGAGRRTRVGLALAEAERVESRSPRRAAALALAALALGAIDLGLVRHALVRRDEALVRAIEREARAALPGVRLVAPRTQLEAAVAAAARRRQRLGGPTTAIEVLRELTARVPPTVQLDLDEMAIEPDGLLLHGRCTSFDGVDALRRALAASPLLIDVTADDTRTTVDGRRVEFKLRATRRQAPGMSS